MLTAKNSGKDQIAEIQKKDKHIPRVEMRKAIETGLLTENAKESAYLRLSKTRARVEHVFGSAMTMSHGRYVHIVALALFVHR